MQAAWAAAVARLESLGGRPVPDFDFAPFAETAVLLYGAAFVAERYAGIRAFLEGPKGDDAAAAAAKPAAGGVADIARDARMLKVIRTIINKTSGFSSADVFEGLQQLLVLRGKVRGGTGGWLVGPPADCWVELAWRTR